MAIRGDLRDVGLADVCQLLALSHKSGCLSVTDRTRFGQIYFDEGRITFATISNRRDRLGDMLVRDGVLDYDQLAVVVDYQALEPDRRLGELLVEHGLIDQAQLESYIRLQIEEAVHHLLTWTQGHFSFEVGPRPGENEILVALNTESVLLEGARRTDEWHVISQKIPSLDLCFQVNSERLAFNWEALTPEQEAILLFLDGSTSVHRLAELTGETEFETGKALYGLIQAGLVRDGGRRDAADSNGEDAFLGERFNLGLAFFRAGMLEDAEREFQAVLERSESHVEARFQLASVAIRQDRRREALVQLKRLMDDAGPQPGAFLNLAVALMRFGRLEHALLSLDQVETLRRGVPLAALLRGAVLLRQEKPRSAAVHFAEYVRRLDPGEMPVAPYYHDAALALALCGKLRHAETLLQEGMERHPTSAPLSLLAGAVAERAGKFGEADRWYRRAAEQHPLLPQPHRNLGDLKARVGALDDALDHYERAVELDPTLGDDTYMRMGNVYYQRKELDRAVRFWERALEINPNNRVVHNNLKLAIDVPG